MNFFIFRYQIKPHAFVNFSGYRLAKVMEIILYPSESIMFAFIIFLIISTLQAYSQNGVTLRLYVKEALKGETMISVTIYIAELETGVVTNTYGFYSITLPAGKYKVEYRCIRYKAIIRDFDLTDNHRVDIEFVEEARQMEEVVIRADRINQNVSSIEMSINLLDMKESSEIGNYRWITIMNWVKV